MRAARRQLRFRDVDGLAFAAANGKLDETKLVATYVPYQLGPLLELMQLYAGGRLPRPINWLVLDGIAPFLGALEQKKETWVSARQRHIAFIGAARTGRDAESRFTGFLMKAKRAGHDVSGLPTIVSGQLVAAMQELENNIHEHADAPETGIVAYRAEPGVFEFVVADRGIGILRSLRSCARHTELGDEGEALEAALTDGVSRYGLNHNRGYGFRPIFTGLVNLQGELRFRSGDHAVTMDGTSPAIATARTSQKAAIDGFFASITCHARSSYEGRALVN